MRDRQAGGYHRFFSQFTIPAARPLLDAARVTAGSTILDADAGPGYAARAARARSARVVAAGQRPTASGPQPSGGYRHSAASLRRPLPGAP